MKLQQLKDAFSDKILPEAKQDGTSKLAAVMIVIYGSEPKIIMTERPKSMNQHAGEISFPGGKWKDDDNDLLETAIRETKEEIDLDIRRNQVIGQLAPVTTLNSGFKITGFISILDDIPKLNSNAEIETIFQIPITSFLKTLADDTDPNHRSIQEMFILTHNNKIIWGASARMLKQMVDVLSTKRLL